METQLSLLKDRLLIEGCSVEMMGESEELPFPHLKFDMGLDPQHRQVNALMWLFGKPTEKGLPAAKHEDLFLQIFVQIPFKYTPNTLIPLARYVLLINKVVIFPGFGISESEHSLYFKYTLCFYKGLVKAELIANFMGAIQFIYDTHTPNLETLASGKKTFEEITGSINSH